MANDQVDDTIYYAELTVENTFNDVLHYTIKFVIQDNSGAQRSNLSSSAPASFTAEYDCENQAMVLTYTPNSEEQEYSIYRREYGVFLDPTHTEGDPYNVGEYRMLVGHWEPVALHRAVPQSGGADKIRDFNIVNGKSYQYVVYPADSNPDTEPNTTTQVFANYLGDVWYINHSGETPVGGIVSGDTTKSIYYGAPTFVRGAECWSMVELEPIDYDQYAPLVRGAYRVNNDNIWLFRFNVETGEQAQNLGRSEF